MAISKEANAPVESTVRSRISDPATALDAAEFLVHYLVKVALRQHRRLTAKPPKLLYLPRAMEAAIQIDLARSEDQHVKLRKNGAAEQLFGCPVIWDAAEFKID